MSKKRDTRCGVCEVRTFERNNYFFGKEMYPRDFCQEQEYFNEKRWLLNRSMFGWGVVCGLDVHWDEETRRLLVDEGLALDCCGHEVLVCEEQCISLEEIERHCGERSPGRTERLVLCLEYDECKTEPVSDPLGDACDARDRPRYNRIRDTFKIRVRRWEDLCIDEGRKRICYLDAIKRDEGQEKHHCRTQGMHDYLCDESKHCPECAACECLVLAVVAVEYRAASPEAKPELPSTRSEQTSAESERPEAPRVHVDSCKYRRLVYRNPLLYDLIECFHGDLPHIVEFGWRADTRPDRKIAFEDFESLITDKKGIRVEIDEPIHSKTLNRNTFFVTVFVEEAGTGYRAPKRLPCDEVDYEELDDCYRATFLPEKDWVTDELKGRHSELADGFYVEITLRGSLIEGTNRKALDGDYVGGRLPTGNGVQGGDFVDYFRVEPRPHGGGGKKGREASAEDVEVIEDY